MSRPTEFDLVSRLPVTHRRRIGWSDTDAARIAYTVRFFEFAMAGIEAWFREIWGEDWFHMNTQQQRGTPFVRVETDIFSSLVPGDILDVQVLVEQPGTSSLTFKVYGHKADTGERVLEGRYVCVVVRTEEGMAATPIPDGKRERITHYITECNRILKNKELKRNSALV